MSFQVTILKVLAGHPEGRASLADLRRAVAILISSGSDWTDRTKRLAARAPGLDIFAQALVLRDNSGWQITDAGRALLASVEKPAPVMATSDQGPKATPIRYPLRQTTWQGRRSPSQGTTNVNCAGIPVWFDTVSAAPVSDRSRTLHSVAPSPNSIVPAKTRARCDPSFDH